MDNKESIETFDKGIQIFHHAKSKDDVKKAEVLWRIYHENLLLLDEEQRKGLLEEHIHWVLERLPETTYHWIRFMDDLKIWGFLEEMDALIVKTNKNEENTHQYPLADRLFIDCAAQFVLGSMELGWSLNNSAMGTDPHHYPTLMTRAMMYAREGNDKDVLMFYQILYEEYPEDVLVQRAITSVARRLSMPKLTITVLDKEEGTKTIKENEDD